LLPFIFSGLVYGGAEHSVNRGGCAFLHMAPASDCSGLATTASWPSLDEGLFEDGVASRGDTISRGLWDRAGRDSRLGG